MIDVGNDEINRLKTKDRYSNNWREDLIIFPTGKNMFMNVHMLLY